MQFETQPGTEVKVIQGYLGERSFLKGSTVALFLIQEIIMAQVEFKAITVPEEVPDISFRMHVELPTLAGVKLRPMIGPHARLEAGGEIGVFGYGVKSYPNISLRQ